MHTVAEQEGWVPSLRGEHWTRASTFRPDGGSGEKFPLSKRCQESLKGWIGFARDKLFKTAIQAKEQNLQRCRGEEKQCVAYSGSGRYVTVWLGQKIYLWGPQRIHWTGFLCSLRSLDFILQETLKDFEHRYPRWGLQFVKIIQSRAYGRLIEAKWDPRGENLSWS